MNEGLEKLVASVAGSSKGARRSHAIPPGAAIAIDLPPRRTSGPCTVQIEGPGVQLAFDVSSCPPGRQRPGVGLAASLMATAGVAVCAVAVAVGARTDFTFAEGRQPATFAANPLGAATFVVPFAASGVAAAPPSRAPVDAPGDVAPPLVPARAPSVSPAGPPRLDSGIAGADGSAAEAEPREALEVAPVQHARVPVVVRLRRPHAPLHVALLARGRTYAFAQVDADVADVTLPAPGAHAELAVVATLQRGRMEDTTIREVRVEP